MSAISSEQRVFMIQTYYSVKKSLSSTQRKFCTKYSIKKKKNAPSLQFIRSMIHKFEKSGCILNGHRKGRGRSSVIRKKLDESLNQMTAAGDHVTVRNLASNANCSASTAYTFLRTELKLYPYKITTGQVLTDQQRQKRLQFSLWMLKKIEDDSRFLHSILWTDECSFSLSGHVNRQNYRFWGKEQPSNVFERPLFEKKLCVFVALSAKFALKPFFFENADGALTTVNGARYADMVNSFVVPQLKKHHALSRSIWQQDGAAPHVATHVKFLITKLFGNRVISRGFENEWPANSPDLNPLDYWLWSLLKCKIFKFDEKPKTFSELKEKITIHLSAINKEMLISAVENVIPRLKACVNQNGGHFEHFL